MPHDYVRIAEPNATLARIFELFVRGRPYAHLPQRLSRTRTIQCGSLASCWGFTTSSGASLKAEPSVLLVEEHEL